MTTPDSNLDKQQLITPLLPEAALRDALDELYDLEGRSIKAYSVRLAARVALDALVERVEVAERERDERAAGAEWQYEMGKAWKERAEAAEAERGRLREALAWIEAEPEDPVKVQLWARAALQAEQETKP